MGTAYLLKWTSMLVSVELLLGVGPVGGVDYPRTYQELSSVVSR